MTNTNDNAIRHMTAFDDVMGLSPYMNNMIWKFDKDSRESKYMSSCSSEESILSESSSESSSEEDSPPPIKPKTKHAFYHAPPAVITAMNNRFKSELNGNDANPVERRSQMNELYMRTENELYDRRDVLQPCPVPESSLVQNTISNPGYSIASLDATKEKCTQKLEDTKDKCGKPAFKYDMCSYHWGLWKREYPYLTAPGKY